MIKQLNNRSKNYWALRSGFMTILAAVTGVIGLFQFKVAATGESVHQSVQAALRAGNRTDAANNLQKLVDRTGETVTTNQRLFSVPLEVGQTGSTGLVRMNVSTDGTNGQTLSHTNGQVKFEESTNTFEGDQSRTVLVNFQGEIRRDVGVQLTDAEMQSLIGGTLTDQADKEAFNSLVHQAVLASYTDCNPTPPAGTTATCAASVVPTASDPTTLNKAELGAVLKRLRRDSDTLLPLNDADVTKVKDSLVARLKAGRKSSNLHSIQGVLPTPSGSGTTGESVAVSVPLKASEVAQIYTKIRKIRGENGSQEDVRPIIESISDILKTSTDVAAKISSGDFTEEALKKTIFDEVKALVSTMTYDEATGTLKFKQGIVRPGLNTALLKKMTQSGMTTLGYSTHAGAGTFSDAGEMTAHAKKVVATALSAPDQQRILLGCLSVPDRLVADAAGLKFQPGKLIAASNMVVNRDADGLKKVIQQFSATPPQGSGSSTPASSGTTPLYVMDYTQGGMLSRPGLQFKVSRDLTTKAELQSLDNQIQANDSYVGRRLKGLNSVMDSLRGLENTGPLSGFTLFNTNNAFTEGLKGTLCLGLSAYALQDAYESYQMWRGAGVQLEEAISSEELLPTQTVAAPEVEATTERRPGRNYRRMVTVAMQALLTSAVVFAILAYFNSRGNEFAQRVLKTLRLDALAKSLVG